MLILPAMKAKAIYRLNIGAMRIKDFSRARCRQSEGSSAKNCRLYARGSELCGSKKKVPANSQKQSFTFDFEAEGGTEASGNNIESIAFTGKPP